MPKCRLKGCQAAVDPGFDLCFAHRLEQDRAKPELLKERQDQIEADFRETFASEPGLRVLGYLTSAFFLEDTTLAFNKKGTIDPYLMVAHEGGRLAVLRILALAGRLNLQDMEALCRKKK